MRYGPQTAEIETLIEWFGRLTPGEIQGLADVRIGTAAARNAAWDATNAARAAAWADARAGTAAAWDVAWAATANVARGAAWTDARAAWDAVNAARAAARTGTAAARADAWDAANAAWAARSAALALACRHLIGTCGYTWGHYRTLVGPAATVFGKLHSDDQEIL